MGCRACKALFIAGAAVLLWLAAGCIKEVPPSPQEVLLPPAELQERLGSSWISPSFSSDGKWIATPWVVESPIRIFDTLKGNTVFTVTLPPSDIAASLKGWSPDSSSLAYSTMETGCQMCPYSHILLIDVDEPSRSPETYLYDLPPENYHIEAFWFPHGDRLAVLIDWKQLIVLDRQATPQASLVPPFCGAEHILDVETVDTGKLFLITGSLVPPRDAPEIEFNLCEVTGESLEELHLLYRSPQRMEIVAYHPEERSLLLALRTTEAETMTLQRFDLAQRRVEEAIEVKGTTIREVSSFGAWTALNLHQEYGEDHLLIFDWRTHNLTDSGEILELIGWQDKLEGFLVTRGAREDRASQHFEVIKP